MSVAIGNSSLCCICVTYFECWLTPLLYLCYIFWVLINSLVWYSIWFLWWWLALGKWDDCWSELIVSLGRCQLASSTVQWWQPMASCTPLATGTTVVLVMGPQLTRRFQSVSWAWSITRSAMWVYQSVFLLWHKTKKTMVCLKCCSFVYNSLGNKNED